jgi:hypothetical protein
LVDRYGWEWGRFLSLALVFRGILVLRRFRILSCLHPKILFPQAGNLTYLLIKFC